MFSDQSQRSFRIPRTFMATFLAVLVTLGMCWSLYENHVSARKSYLIERNFRFLARQGDNLVQAVAAYKYHFQSIPEEMWKGVRSRIPEQSSCDGGSHLLGPKDNKTPSQALEQENGHSLVAALCKLPNVKRVTVQKREAAKKSVRDEGQFWAGSTGNELSLHYRQAGWEAIAYIDTAKLMSLLPMEELYGDLLVIDRNGTVLSQRKSARTTSESHFVNLKMILQKNKEKLSTGNGIASIVPPALETFQIGTTDYLMFAQAGSWPFGQEASLHPAETDGRSTVDYDFLLAGIVPAHAFELEVWAIPWLSLLAIIGVIFAAVLSLPYVKLAYTGLGESLSRRDVLTVICSAVLWVALFTFSLATFVTLTTTRQYFDKRLEASARWIETHFRADLKDALGQLEEMDSLCREQCLESGGRLKHDGKLSDLWSQEWQIVQGDGRSFSIALRDPHSKSIRRLIFDDLFQVLWVDKGGKKVVDWSWHSSPNRVPLGEREYVKRIRAGASFWVQPIYSRTTGENHVIISRQSNITPATGGPLIAVLEGKMPSVMGPVVLPGVGFAIIDEAGEVQFHSDASRNLRENFLAETDHNEELQSYLWTSSPGLFSGQYWGRDRRFYVTPLDLGQGSNIQDRREHRDRSGRGALPMWSLVVYLDKDIVETTILEALFLAVSLFVVYAVLILGVGLFGYLMNHALKFRQAQWMWPQATHAGTYAHVFCLNVVLLLLYGAVDTSTPVTLFLILFLPGLLALVTHYFIRPKRFSLMPGRLVPDFRQGYLLMSMSALLLFATLPAVAFFKVAFNEEMKLYAAFTQFDYQNDLKAGRQQLSDFYQADKFGSQGYDSLSPSEPEALREAFMRERQGRLDQATDRTFLFNPGQEPRLSGLLPAYGAFRRALGNHFAAETARFLEQRPEDKVPSDSTAVAPPPQISNRLYWILIASGLAGCLLGWILLASEAKNWNSERLPNSAFVLMGLAVGVFLLLWWSNLGILIIGLGLFIWLIYTLPRLVADQIFFLSSPLQRAVGGSVNSAEGRGSVGDLRVTWETCSPAEKLALTHLAQDRFLTANDSGLPDLKQKGLVTFAPNLQLAQDSDPVRTSIYEMSDKEHILEQSHERTAKAWGQGIGAVKIGLLGLAGFVLFTQEQYRPIVLAVLAPVLPMLLKLPPGLDLSKVFDGIKQQGTR